MMELTESFSAFQRTKLGMVVTLFVSAPIIHWIFVLELSNFGTKYLHLSTTNTSLSNFSNYITEFINWCQIRGVPLLQPAPLSG